ncbi:NAD(P)-binding domain-containing protein [Streptomyces sp. NPDC051664]|uniref:NAD(P)-binding domain-containing protein n=1 Tax=Streptomyces sp. NPDC051664 TaxID=3365668 RepID=UPI0037A6893A
MLRLISRSPHSSPTDPRSGPPTAAQAPNWPSSAIPPADHPPAELPGQHARSSISPETVSTRPRPDSPRRRDTGAGQLPSTRSRRGSYGRAHTSRRHQGSTGSRSCTKLPGQAVLALGWPRRRPRAGGGCRVQPGDDGVGAPDRHGAGRPPHRRRHRRVRAPAGPERAIVDRGNAHYAGTRCREAALRKLDIRFLDTGISGSSRSAARPNSGMS